MLFYRIFIVTLAFALNISAYNPFKNKRVEGYNNLDRSAVQEEVVTLRESLTNLLSGKCVDYHFNTSVSGWLKNINYKVHIDETFDSISEIADVFIVLNYKRKSVRTRLTQISELLMLRF